MTRTKPLAYSGLDLKGAPAYRLRLQALEWGCVAELLRDAPYDVNDVAREAIADWAERIARAWDLEPRRMVVFEADQEWTDFLWYVLTLPAAGELEDIARSVRSQVMRTNSTTKRRNRERYWESLRTQARTASQRR